jgi:hypothetical protein
MIVMSRTLDWADGCVYDTLERSFRIMYPIVIIHLSSSLLSSVFVSGARSGVSFNQVSYQK